MTDFSFEGFTIGTPVDLSATQGSETVSGAVATWGEQAAGTATIGIDQSDTVITQYDSVMLRPTAWGSFDTPGTHAASGDIYNPRYHDIVYFWDTGKTGDFQAPQNLIAAHKSRQHAHGPVVKVCYDTPGVYQVRLYAYEPSSGKYAITTTTVTVNSADNQYPGTQTICINPNGDSDFSAAPPGAQTFELASGNAFDETHPAWANMSGSSPYRFLFKGGESFVFNLNASSSDWISGLMLGSYGSGRATIDATGSGGNIDIQDAESSDVKLFINNLIFQGDFNPTTNSGGPARLIAGGGRMHLVMHRIDIDGYGGSVIDIRPGNFALSAYHHFDDVKMTNMGGQYPILAAPLTSEDSSIAFTGCRITRHPESDFLQGFSGLGGDQRAPVRINEHNWIYFQATEIFQNTGDQPCIKMAESGIPGGIHSIHCCTLESARGNIFKFQDGDSGNFTNLIMRQNVLIQSSGPGGGRVDGMLIGGQGCSIDANLFISLGTIGAIPARTSGGFIFNYPSPAVTPNYMRNNTYVHYKNATENNSSTDPGLFFGGNGNVTAGSNVEYLIGFQTLKFDGVTQTFTGALLEDGPTGVALFAPRNTGRFNYDSSGVFDTDWGAAPAHIYSFQPEAGSALLGARTTEPFYPFPIDAQSEHDIRPSGTEDLGCWQGTA